MQAAGFRRASAAAWKDGFPFLPLPGLEADIQLVTFLSTAAENLHRERRVLVIESVAGLKSALERYPAADTNADGVLTMEEAKAFKSKMEADAPEEKKREKGSGKSVSHVYKTVGKQGMKLFVDSPKDHQADAKAPAIVFFHGGGFRSGSEIAFERQPPC